MMKPAPTTPRKKEKGQILVILALIFVGLVAVVGLAIDLGYMYVSYARLRRAVDAAALGAVTQFKKNVPASVLQKAAREFLVLNGLPNSTSVSALIDTCATAPGDPELCTAPPRKLVRVTANEQVPMFFLSIVGINSVPIRVTTVSEAAAVDLVLVLDRSESMGWYKPDLSERYPIPSINGDPVSCNTSTPANAPDNNPAVWVGDCHPFHEVKSAAYTFVDAFMDPEYDRIAIVVFDQIGRPVNFGDATTPIYLYGKSDNAAAKTILLDAVRKLWMYDGFPSLTGGDDLRSPIVYTDHGVQCPFTYEDPIPLDFAAPCRLKNNAGQYFYLTTPGMENAPYDYSNSGTTNIGSGLNWAAHILQAAGREEALWVTIVLTDGIPNIGYDEDNKNICPPGTRDRLPWCNDKDPDSRHAFDPGSNLLYDVNDYTRDQADILADGVQSFIFAIGLGPEVVSLKYTEGQVAPAQGATLLNYIAEKGGTTEYYQADPTELQRIFLAIANKIATKLTK
jgi:Flp pilus assembly protein TadG